MQYSNADLFFNKQSVGTATSDVLANNYNRNWEAKAYLAVHANTTAAVTVTLYTGATNTAVNTVVGTWTATPNADGYVVMDKLPRGIGKFMKLKVEVASDTATVTAGIVLEQDMDYDWSDRDPKAIFDGVKTETEVRTEIAE
jgi:hypothetical protein